MIVATEIKSEAKDSIKRVDTSLYIDRIGIRILYGCIHTIIRSVNIISLRDFGEIFEYFRSRISFVIFRNDVWNNTNELSRYTYREI